MTVQTHWFREHPALVAAMIGFMVTASLFYLILGRIGILFALGFAALFLLTYLLMTAFGSFLDPDVY
jgi:hypothetical protein